MSPRPRLLATILATLLSGVVFAQASSCALDPAGELTPTTEEACAVAANCDDQNPCTTDVCEPDGTCSRTAVGDGPLPGQTAGDCQRIDCAAGLVVTTNDDADVGDDGEPCTTDGCAAGTATSKPLTDGTSCTSGATAGSCEAGVCTVECGQNKPCDDQNPCTEDTCNAVTGTCLFMDLDGLPTPGFVPVSGDCVQHICVAGVDTPIHDDADLPNDMNPCSQDVCTSGVPSNPPSAEGAPCALGMPEVCDGLGTCVACNVPEDCVLLPPNDECQMRTCTGHVCGQGFTAMGTALASQKSGDCKSVVCDGAGSSIVVTADADLPNDNNPCTIDMCAAGVPSNPNVAQGTSCGSPLVCDATGTCVGCNDPSDCPGTDDFCKTRTCTNQQCGYSYTAAGTDLPSGQMAMDCKVVECDGAGNPVVSPDTLDKPVDGNQCTKDVCSAAGVPSNPPEAVKFACNQNGGLVCNGAGNCMKADAQGCAGGAECLSAFCVDKVCCDTACSETCKACDVAANLGKCSNVTSAAEDAPTCIGANACDGSGVCKKDNGQTCGIGADCVSGFCADGVCCESACTTACRTCNAMGTAGTCTILASAEDTAPANVCSGTKSCDAAGACKLKDSNACGIGADCLSGHCIDGLCCNTTCGETCKACNLPAALGVCSFVGANQDDVGTCAGATQSCDGSGVCKKDNGQTCAVAGDCLSGFCADGVCCNNACGSACQACTSLLKGSGADGACGNIAVGSDPQNECASGSCNGAGSCRLDNGTVCTLSSQCLGGNCVDGVCCNSACGGACQACSAAIKGQGADGACGPIKTATDPEAECTPGSCNGASACKLDLGDVCSLDSDCLSGTCADGVCCNSACTGGCQACSAAIKGQGTNGLCEPIKAGSDPANECAAGSCNGAGLCKLDNGGSCGAAGDCLSGHCTDGVCCDGTCGGTCEACSAALKGQGANGVCGPIKANTDPTSECAAGVCNGMGACIGGQGDACMTGAQCITGVCADGVCCDMACMGTCQACTAALKGHGIDGACEPITAGTDPLNQCATGVCDGAGMCIGAIGDMCLVAADCLSNFCADGVCCNSACGADCSSCGLAGKEGTCSPVPAGWDDGMCLDANGMTCNGLGACNGDTGAACTDGAECVSASCTALTCDMPATCTSLAKDGTESDVDCGGLCAKCVATMTCNVGTDCASGICTAGVCQ